MLARAENGDYRLGQPGKGPLQELAEELAALLASLPSAFDDDCSALTPWLGKAGAGWSGGSDRHPLADVLDGALLVPLLARLDAAAGDARDREIFEAVGSSARQAWAAFLIGRQWARGSEGNLALTAEGRALMARASELSAVALAWPRLQQLESLLFGKTEQPEQVRESALLPGFDRRSAAILHGLPYSDAVAEIADAVVSYLEGLPDERLPTYIADLGCDDDALLSGLHRAIEERLGFGKAKGRGPLTLIAVASDAARLDVVGRGLTELPHRLVQADCADPSDLGSKLEALGIETDDVLFVSLFRSFHPASAMRPVLGAHGLIALEAHASAPEGEPGRLHVDALCAFADVPLVEAPSYLLEAAEAGLLARTSAAKRFPKGASHTRLSLNHFVPSPLRVRRARPDDVPALVTLDGLSQAPGLRNSEAQIEGRISVFPQGQLVLERDGEVIGAIFSQRIASVDLIDGVTMETAESLHRPDGRVGQLLLILVHPDHRQSMGAEELLGFALDYLSLVDGIERVVGVTRCRDFARRADRSMSHADYVAQRDSLARPLDPVLLMHAAQGARIERVMPGYRAGDSDNEGYGVLVSYDLDKRQERKASGPKRPAAGVSRDLVAAKVRDAVDSVLGAERADAFEAARPFMEMGLESLDLLALRRMLSEAMAEPLDASFFFRYSTPEAVVRYFMKEEASGQEEAVRAAKRGRSRPASVIAEGKGGEGFAIVGMAGRFPGAPSVADFWALLTSGREGVGAIPPDRWRLFEAGASALGDLPRRAGLLPEVDRFDAAFFRIAPREATLLDPQQRLLLEVVWHALEDADLPPERLAGAATGFFVGLMGHDYETLLLQGRPKEIDGHFASGCAGSIAAGRIAYFFDWQGPAVTIDTACSSSLVAVHQACRSLAHGDCRQAIAAGVNLTLTAPYSLAYWQAGMLAPDGRCKTFDAAADGYVRAEGCAAVVLKRLADAEADGDRILAVVRGSAVNQDGTGIGLTAPNENAQSRLIEEALESAGVAPSQIGYLECHGTGTKLGDPIEVRAAARALGPGRSPESPLLLGAVKASIGHLEGAAGIAGLIKIVLAMRHDRIPGQVNYRDPNPLIPWAELPLSVVAETTPWPVSPSGRRLAGVSSFGFSGTNAHLVVEGYAAAEEDPRSDVAGPWHQVPVKLPEIPDVALSLEESQPRRHVFLPLSAKSDAALAALAESYRSWLGETPGVEPADLAYSAGVGRTHFGHRAGLVFENTADLGDRLSALIEDRATAGLATGSSDGAPKLAFLFTGQGSQYLGMGKGLYAQEPVVRAVLDRCESVIRDLRGASLLEVMFEDGADGSLDHTAWTQPALYALEVALVELYRSLGVDPAVVMGHSVGEYAAAYTAGVFGLEEGLRLIAERGALMGELPAGGAMAAIFAEPERVARVAAEVGADGGHGVEIASDNGRHQVVSGPKELVDRVAERFAGEGVRTASLQTSHAFHSSLLDPMLEGLERAAGSLQASAPKITLISNVTGAPLPASGAPDAAYWRRHARQPVRFAESVAALSKEGVDLVLEIGPHPVLTGMLQLAWPEGASPPSTAASLRRGSDEGAAFAAACAELYVAGAALDHAAPHAGEARRKVPLPGYPFQRQRFWPEASDEGRAAGQVESGILRLLAEGDEDSLIADLGLDAEDDTARQVLRAVTKRYSAEQATASVQDLLYRVDWRAIDTPAATAGDPGQWLVLSQGGDLGDALVTAFKDLGAACTLSPLSESTDALKTLLDSDAPLTGVVLLIDTPMDDPSSMENARRVLALAQAAMAGEVLAPLHLVTRGAHAIGEEDGVPRPDQRALWGLGRVLGLEQPALFGRMIDLPLAEEQGLADRLAARLASEDAEDQVALRSGTWLVPRLVPFEGVVAAGNASLSADVSYLVSGGLGALGLAMAGWLAGQGAKHLVLVGRRAPTDAAISRIAALVEDSGCHIETASLDVADGDAVNAFVARFDGREWPPLGGVIHAAGVERVEGLAEITPESFDEVCRGKVRGAWNLHRATRDLDGLEIFFCLSSIASVWGSQGQAHYASANAFLDGLVEARRAAGLPAAAVNFGPWSDGGMADQAMQSWLVRAGVQVLSPAEGIAVIDAALSDGLTGLVAARVDWPTFTAVMEARRGRPLFAHLRDAREAPAIGAKTDLVERIEAAPLAGRKALLVEEVRGLTSAVLGLAPDSLDASTGFFDLGMDSLMAVELRRRLERAVGIALPATLAMDYPNADAVAAFLLDRHLGQGKADAGPAARSVRSDEAIAIVGMSCRVPGAENLEAFWALLERGGDGIVEIPDSRFDVGAYFDPDMDAPGKMYTRKAGLIEGIDHFDPQFFAISPREAESMDPQQRLLLEEAFEALERAGLSPAGLKHSRTGVYVGISANEYSERLGVAGRGDIDSHFATGRAASAVAGRVAFALGLEGPAMAVDTACSSSLVALHQACLGLRAGDCDLALAGGVNTLLSPDMMIATCRARMLSPDGYCKTFDARADGYVRAEGVGVLVLKRLSDAERDGDRILALVRGSAVNQDGASSGLTVPNGPAQERVIEDALAMAGVLPGELSYLECHGTGTALGDPIEVQAAAAVYGRERDGERPLLLGAAKANVGHLESGAGIVGVIKTVLAQRHGVIPGQAHYETPNPHIPWDNLPVAVVDRSLAWPEGRRLAGVSSFGFTGTNAHVILEGFDEAGSLPSQPGTAAARRHRFLPLSAKNADALKELAQRYLGRLDDGSEAELADIAYTAGVGRSHFSHRAGLVFDGADELRDGLSALADNAADERLVTGQVGRGCKVAFLFTGQGSQYLGMGKALYEQEPVVRDVLDRCDAAIRDLRGLSLLDVMFEGLPGHALDDTAWTQPALYALEVALVELYRGAGIEPAVVLGHSVGEYAAAYAAGVFGLEEGLRLIAARGSLMGDLPAGGSMAAVFAAPEAVAQVVEAVNRGADQAVEIAAFNGAHQVVSGPSGLVEAAIQRFDALGVRCQPLQTSHAFHSPLLEPMLGALEEAAGGLAVQPPRCALISNVTGAVCGPQDRLDGAYWRRHAREAVQFEACVKSLAETGADVVLEIGPHPVLTTMAAGCWPDSAEAPLTLTSLRRGAADGRQLALVFANLYAKGADLRHAALFSGETRAKCDLPTYPYQRQRYWPAPLKGPVRREGHALLGRKQALARGQVVFESEISSNAPAWLAEHRVFDRVVFPGAGYIAMAGAGALRAKGSRDDAASPLSGAVAVTDLQLHSPLVLADAVEGLEVQLLLDRAQGTGSSGAKRVMEIYSRQPDDDDWTLHADGEVEVLPPDGQAREGVDLGALRQGMRRQDVASLYETYGSVGLAYGPAFRGLKSLWAGEGEALGEVRLESHLNDKGLIVHPALLDGCLQAVAAALPTSVASEAWLPFACERIELFSRLADHAVCHLRLRQAKTGDTAPQTVTADIDLYDEEGRQLGRIAGFTFKRASREALRSQTEGLEDLLYEVTWRQRPLESDPTAATPGLWVIAAERSGGAMALAEALNERGQSVVLAVQAGREAETSVPAEGPALSLKTMDLGDRAGWLGLLDALPDSLPLHGVVHLSPTPEAAAERTPDALKDAAEGCTASALALAQGLLDHGRRPTSGLWYLTRGAQAVDSDPADDLAASTLWGFAQTLSLEAADLPVTLVDLDARDEALPSDLVHQLLDSDGESHLAFREGARWVARLAKAASPVRLPQRGPWRLREGSDGTLESLSAESMATRVLEEGEVRVAVKAAGLNFRDVLVASGLYPETGASLGNEFCGRVVEVGPGVASPALGDRVVGLSLESFCSEAVTRAELTAPASGGHADSALATIPVVFSTARIAFDLAELKVGERVLIHAGAGGVGLAAIQLARLAGAEVLATASKPKQDYLRSLGVRQVFDSRSTDFAAGVMAATGGKGVDVVLNSLTGEGFIEASLSCLAEGGRFIEIAKRNIWSPEAMAEARPDVAYHLLALDHLMADRPALVGAALQQVMQGFARGDFEPLPSRAWPMTAAPEAMRYMREARHIGKVVLTAPAVRSGELDPDRSYLVTGGLGGIGLQVAQWLATRGARHIALNARREPDAAAQEVIGALEEQGVEIRVVLADVGEPEEVTALLDEIGTAMPPLAGIVHSVGVLSDGAVVNLDREDFRAVLKAKVVGGWALHRATAAMDLDLFVLFSSVAGVIGNPGQANYAAANYFLDQLAHHRRARGLPGQSIAWGAWSGLGLAEEQRARIEARLRALGMGWIDPDRGIEALDYLLRHDVAMNAVVPMDWPVFAARGGRPRTFFQDLQGRSAPVARESEEDLLARLEAADGDAREGLLRGWLAAEVQAILRLKEKPGAAIGFLDLGMDSLTTIEFSRRLERVLGLKLDASVLFDYPNVEELSRFIVQQLAPEAEEVAETFDEAADGGDDIVKELESLLGNE